MPRQTGRYRVRLRLQAAPANLLRVVIANTDTATYLTIERLRPGCWVHVGTIGGTPLYARAYRRIGVLIVQVRIGPARSPQMNAAK